MRRFIFTLLLFVLPAAVLADPPAHPASIIVLMGKIDADNAAIATADKAIAADKSKLDADTKAHVAAEAALETDRAAFRAALEKYSGDGGIDLRPRPKPPIVNPPKPDDPPAADKIPLGSLQIIGIVPSMVAATPAQLQPGEDARTNGTALNTLLTSKQAHCWWAGVKEFPSDWSVYLTRAQADGLPRVLIVNITTSTVVASVPLCDTAGLIALVNQWSQ